MPVPPPRPKTLHSLLSLEAAAAAAAPSADGKAPPPLPPRKRESVLVMRTLRVCALPRWSPLVSHDCVRARPAQSSPSLRRTMRATAMRSRLQPRPPRRRPRRRAGRPGLHRLERRPR